MQERRDSGLEGYRKREMQKRRDAGKEVGCSKGGIEDWKDS